MLQTIDRVGREFIMEGPLYKTKSGRKLHACLFNDMFILAQPIRGLSPQGYLYTLYKEPMPTDRIQVRGSSKPGLGKVAFSPHTSFERSPHAFLTPNPPI